MRRMHSGALALRSRLIASAVPLKPAPTMTTWRSRMAAIPAGGLSAATAHGWAPSVAGVFPHATESSGRRVMPRYGGGDKGVTVAAAGIPRGADRALGAAASTVPAPRGELAGP